MYRTKTCGELRLADAGSTVTLCGWVQRTRKMGGMTFVDLRDRYGITQLVFNHEVNADLCDQANKLGREYVIQAVGTVAERSNKNPKMDTGEIEIIVDSLNVLFYDRRRYRWRRRPAYAVSLPRLAPHSSTSQLGVAP